MKKTAALLFLGAFLLVAGLGARFYAYPRLTVVPADLDSKVVAENPPGEPATYFSIAKLAETTDELGNMTKAQVDQVSSEEVSAELDRDVLVVRTYACTDEITEDCSTLRYPLSGALSTLAIDRHTGVPVDWSEASIETGGKVEKGVEFEGLTIKFPFNAQKQTYQFWNADLRTSVPVRFVKETSVDGLHAYEYRGAVEPTVLGQLDIPGSIIGRDEPTVTVDRVTSSETSYLVEPETGVIISATSKQDSYATLDGEKVMTITNGTFTTPDDATAETVDTYRPLATALVALRLWVPLVGTLVGLLLLGYGTLLASRRRRGGTSIAPDHTPVEAELADVR